MKLLKFACVLCILFLISLNTQAQNLLGTLSITQIESELAFVVRTNDSYVFIRSNLTDFKVESNNPSFTKHEYQNGVWYLKINANETYLFRFQASGFITTDPIRVYGQPKQTFQYQLMASISDTKNEDNERGLGNLHLYGSLNYSKLIIDGLPFDGDLPTTLRGIKTGEHEIRTTTSNPYVNASSQTIKVRKDQTDSVYVKDPLKMGYVEFTVFRKPYQIWVDSELVASVTSNRWIQKSDNYLIMPQNSKIAIPVSDSVHISIRKPDYQSLDTLVKLDEGEVLEIKQVLAQKNGFIQFVTENEDHTYKGYIDQKSVSIENNCVFKVNFGEHKINIRKQTRPKIRIQRTINIANGDTTIISIP